MKLVLCPALATVSFLVLPACSGSDVSADEIDPSHLVFVDVASEAGADLVNVTGDPRRWYIPESNGTGAAWLDYDGDGDVDLFVGNCGGMRYIEDGAKLERKHDASSRLYRNDGGLRFTDVTEATGTGRSEWIQAVTAADFDNDGDPDVYLACFGKDVLLKNEGGRFVDATDEAGLGCKLWGTGAAFADPDRDGDLDLFVANYIAFDLEAPPEGGKRSVIEGVEVAWGPVGENKRGINTGEHNRYYRNEGRAGGFRFTDATGEAGLELEEPLCSFAVVFSDVNGDSWPDILVANDMQPCNLYLNTGDGKFEEKGVERGFAYNADGGVTAAMGLSVADHDGDGDFDALRTNFDFEPNCIHVNDGSAQFFDVGGAFGMAEAGMDRLGWGGGFFDADCDGDLDALVANGHVYPQAEEIGMHGWLQKSQLFEARPEGGAVSYHDVTERTGTGLNLLRSARGVAFGDPDDDGDLDAVIVDIDAPVRLLENRSERRGQWLRVRLIGRESNRDGLGARVTVRSGEARWVREARTSDGLFSSHDPRLHFGLGEIETVDEVVVEWPSGLKQVIPSPKTNQTLTVEEGVEAR